MRRLLQFLTVFAGCALSLSAVPAAAAPSCASPADQAIYDVLALREAMTVLVTKCKRDTEYNVNFVKRFQSALQANDRAVLAYFRRVYGGAGQGKMDYFTTELANTLSQQANVQGTEFCSREVLLVGEMNALRTNEELTAYAGVKDLSPVGMSMCPVTAAAPAARRGR
jgi:hypothetical protein